MLLLRNSFGVLKENKAITAGIVALMFLTCFVFSLFNHSFSILKQSNAMYFIEQNVYDFTILPSMTEEENASDNIEKIYDRKMEKLASRFDFYFEVQKTALYIFQNYESEYAYLLIAPQKNINKPYLVEGRLPEKDNEATVTDQYARNNDLEIGGSIDVGGTKFIIVGLAYQPDFIYPALDAEMPDVNTSAESIVFMTDNAIDKLGIEIKYTYSAKFNDGSCDYNRVMDLRAAAEDDTQYINSQNNKINRLRTYFLYQQIRNLLIFSNCLLMFLFFTITFTLIIILRKRVEADKVKLGQLKAIGYSNFEIAVSYISLAAFTGVTGGAFGFVCGYFGAFVIVDILTSTIFQLPVSASGLNLLGLAASALIPLVLFSFVSYIIALFVIKKPPLELIYENKSERISALSKRIAILCKNRSFETQFKFGALTKSPLRFVGVFLIMLTLSVMLITGLIISGMVKFNADAKVRQIEYAYEVAFEKDVNISDIHTDVYFEPSYNMRLYAKEGVKANGQVINYDALINNDNAMDDFYVDVMAFEPDNRLRLIRDKTGEVINGKLKGNEIGISAIVSQVLGVGVGDSIVLYDSKETEKTYKVIAISENYDEVDIYAALDAIQNDFGYKGKTNVIYTDGKYIDNDHVFVAVAGSEEIRSFRQADIVTSVLTIVFSSVLVLISFIVLLVLANIIIEENRKSISLLRVLGYVKKEISYMVVDIYTPIVVIAYIAALPISIHVCRLFTDIMAKSVYISFPVEMPPLLFILGGLFLFLSYKIAIRATRRNIKSEEWRRDIY